MNNLSYSNCSTYRCALLQKRVVSITLLEIVGESIRMYNYTFVAYCLIRSYDCKPSHGFSNCKTVIIWFFIFN